MVPASSCTSAAAMFSATCAGLDVPGITRTRGSCARSHARATWAGVAPRAAAAASTAGCSVTLPTQVQEGFVRAVEQAVGVLHAGDADGQRSAELVDGDVAQPDPADLSFLAQRDHLGQLAVQVYALVAARLGIVVGVHEPQVHHAHLLDGQAAQVGLHPGA